MVGYGFHVAGLLIASVILFSVLLTFPRSLQQQDMSSFLYTLDSSPQGISYEDWVKKWWQWNMGLDSNDNLKQNPEADPCPTNQNGSVLFLQTRLSGNMVLNCKIPEGRSLLIPIDGGIGWNDVPFEGYLSDNELMVYARECMPGTDMQITVDNTTLDSETLKKSEVETTSFNITIPEHSYVNENKDHVQIVPSKSVGTYRAVVAGHFIFLKPLNPGPHDITINKSVIGAGEECNSSLQAKIKLMVDPSPT